MCRSTPKGCVRRRACLRQLWWQNYDVCMPGRFTYGVRQTDVAVGVVGTTAVNLVRVAGLLHYHGACLHRFWSTPRMHTQTHTQNREARIRNKSDKLCFSFRQETGLAAVKQKRKEERGLMEPAGENFGHRRITSYVFVWTRLWHSAGRTFT